MARVFLNKDFNEVDGLDFVLCHWLITAPGAEPDWSAANLMALQALPVDHGGWIRRAALPLEVFGDGPWVLHYYFEWIRRGVSETGPAYFEDLIAREVTHNESNPDLTVATLVYNLGESGWTNAVPMVLDGMPTPAPHLGPEWPEEPGNASLQRKYREHVDQAPMPHVFRAKVIGPSGAHVLYSVHLARRQGVNPLADTGHWVHRSELIL